MNCAIAGCGRIGSTLNDDPLREKPASHAAAIVAAKQTLIAACDIDPLKRDAFAKRWKTSAVYTSIDEMLRKHPVDILVIATPPDTHEDLLLKAAHFPLKAVILEKPLAHTIESARKIEAFAIAQKLSVIINHERRFANQYVHIKQQIDNDTRFGKLLSLSMKLYMGRTRSFRDILYDDGTHIIDLAHYLCGDFVFSSAHGNETTLYAGGNTASATISLETGRGRDHLVFEIDCSFERGRIVAGNGYYHEYESRQSPFYRNFRSLIVSKKRFRKSAYFENMFAHACQVAKGVCPSRSSCSDALFALNRAEEILAKAGIRNP